MVKNVSGSKGRPNLEKYRGQRLKNLRKQGPGKIDQLIKVIQNNPKKFAIGTVLFLGSVTYVVTQGDDGKPTVEPVGGKQPTEISQKAEEQKLTKQQQKIKDSADRAKEQKKAEEQKRREKQIIEQQRIEEQNKKLNAPEKVRVVKNKFANKLNNSKIEVLDILRHKKEKDQEKLETIASVKLPNGKLKLMTVEHYIMDREGDNEGNCKIYIFDATKDQIDAIPLLIKGLRSGKIPHDQIPDSLKDAFQMVEAGLALNGLKGKKLPTKRIKHEVRNIFKFLNGGKKANKQVVKFQDIPRYDNSVKTYRTQNK